MNKKSSFASKRHGALSDANQASLPGYRQLGKQWRCIYIIFMISILCEWDAKKDRDNQAKHGVPFEEARSAFFDEQARLVHDPDHSENEDRYILLGMSMNWRILVVCHCYRAKDSIIRIISARKATRKEQRVYEEQLS